MLEKHIETQILTWLNLQPGVFAFKVNTTGIYDPSMKRFRKITNPHIHKGTADIIGLKQGKFFAIEVKTPKSIKKKLTQHDLEQMAFLKSVELALGRVLRTCSLDEVIQFIRTF